MGGFGVQRRDIIEGFAAQVEKLASIFDRDLVQGLVGCIDDAGVLNIGCVLDRVAAFEVEMAKAALAGVEGKPGAEQQVDVPAPVAGKVLRVMRESAGAVQAGAPLLEVGDATALEIVVDVLTRDEALEVMISARDEGEEITDEEMAALLDAQAPTED